MICAARSCACPVRRNPGWRREPSPRLPAALSHISLQTAEREKNEAIESVTRDTGEEVGPQGKAHAADVYDQRCKNAKVVSTNRDQAEVKASTGQGTGYRFPRQHSKQQQREEDIEFNPEINGRSGDSQSTEDRADGSKMAAGRASVSDGPSDGISQPASHVKLTVDVQKDELLGHYGFEVSQQLPLLVTSVAAGSTADGKLLPGDHILAINSKAAEDVTGEEAATLLRESQDTLQFTVLRCTSGGPKSSFLTAEKRARLKTNPVKVRFAEEVVVNGHTQGSSLLCMPNVLKVYLENGQTKAFKFEANTTVKDIILTLKEKLSIRSIDHFALVLEEQYNILKMYLLHEDERIEQVVQRKESHDFRCLFRVCFIPKDPLHLLQQDPVAFEYLYLQVMW
ncbi:FERM and PDZ domain-containing protein 1 [Varanus komodoensis]|nr:FERM and PDZ domain-containing protein 1 [Varanus komodoensis]